MSQSDPLSKCKEDFEKYITDYQQKLSDVFGNRWSDDEVRQQIEAWFPMWQEAYACGMKFVQDIYIPEDEHVTDLDLQK